MGFSQSHSFDTTLVADNYEVKIETKDISEELVLLKTTFNSTIVHLDTINGGGLSDIQFPDFDNDGDRDIVLTYMGNNPFYFLYLFDSKSHRFKEVEDFSLFPEAIPLKVDRNYYYSYHRAGCADMVWVSDLFKIENYRALHLGKILGDGCEGDTGERGIFISHVKTKGETNQIEKLSIDVLDTYSGYKWNFIEDYWNGNLEKFKK